VKPVLPIDGEQGQIGDNRRRARTRATSQSRSRRSLVKERATQLKVLIIGAGVIGTVYGAHLGAAGHAVSVLAHGVRTAGVGRDGLRARDVLADALTESPATVVDRTDAEPFDLVLVALRRDHLPLVSAQLATLCEHPLVLFFGNNPDGRAGLPADISGQGCLGFPGVGGTISDGLAEYVLIAQQPTALEQGRDLRLGRFRDALEGRGLAVQRVGDMSGWLAYHAVFVACVSAALYRCGTDPQRLARNWTELKLMCRAITEGFRGLDNQGVGGLPRNLAVLHARAMQPVAVGYWARSMRSPMGELAFAAHARHAECEMRAVARDVLARVDQDTRSYAIGRLLGAYVEATAR
jgi:2-dehydropantoate 2-reductase